MNNLLRDYKIVKEQKGIDIRNIITRLHNERCKDRRYNCADGCERLKHYGDCTMCLLNFIKFKIKQELDYDQQEWLIEELTRNGVCPGTCNQEEQYLQCNDCFMRVVDVTIYL